MNSRKEFERWWDTAYHDRSPRFAAFNGWEAGRKSQAAALREAADALKACMGFCKIYNRYYSGEDKDLDLECQMAWAKGQSFLAKYQEVTQNEMGQ